MERCGNLVEKAAFVKGMEDNVVARDQRSRKHLQRHNTHTHTHTTDGQMSEGLQESFGFRI